MAIALRGISAVAKAAGAGTLTVSVPAGVVGGDVMILVVESNGTGHATQPAGWTLIDSSLSASTPFADSYVRVASSEPASYDVTVPSASSGMIVAYSGVDNANPVNAHGAWARLGTGANPVAVSITTTVNGCQILDFLAQAAATLATFTPPTGFTTTETGTNPLWYADEAQSTAGATGTATCTTSASGAASQTQLIALAPAAGPAAPTNTVVPAVTGTAQVGATVTTDNGTWTGSPTSYTYQWQDSADGSTGWANIAGQTGSSYVVGSGELTKFLRCVVTATNAGGSTSANSNVVGPVTAAPPPSGSAIGGNHSSPLLLLLS